MFAIKPPRREDFALSPEIGQSVTRFQAHRLWATATGIPTKRSSAISFTAPIRKKVPTMNNGTTKIPELVLASTCDKRPQTLHIAGCSRLDHLVAKEVTPSSLQCGHCVMRFSVKASRRAASIARSAGYFRSQCLAREMSERGCISCVVGWLLIQCLEQKNAFIHREIFSHTFTA
jgi:hypothetical protein